MQKTKELQEELKGVIGGRGQRALDVFLPVVVYILVSALWGLAAAWQTALAVAIAIGLVRLLRGGSLVYVLGGLAGVGLSVLLAVRSDGGEGFFFPGLVSGLFTVVGCFATSLFNRPLVAFTSWAFRRWPLDWYWHPKVLPAYREVTLVWGVVYGMRLALDAWLYIRGDLSALGIARLVFGWPLLLVLLVFTYVYGLWRLGRLGGPSVEEFKAGLPEPWEGQRRGF